MKRFFIENPNINAVLIPAILLYVPHFLLDIFGYQLLIIFVWLFIGRIFSKKPLYVYWGVLHLVIYIFVIYAVVGYEFIQNL